jgi:hypothetical protein
MYLIQCRSDKIIFSNETALYIHELTDRAPLQYSVCVPRGYGIARLQESELVVYTVKKELRGNKVKYIKNCYPFVTRGVITRYKTVYDDNDRIS